MPLKESLGWTQREITEPQQMAASLRYAARMRSEQGVGSFTFPYFKKIDGSPHYIHVRTRTDSLPPHDSYEFCIDVGTFPDLEKQDIFVSSAWVDFSVGLRRIGVIDKSLHIIDHNLESIKRPSAMSQNWGIFVEPALRRQKVATSLVTAARIVLNHFGVPVLLISNIHHMEEGHPTGSFYHSLGGNIFKRNPWTEVIGPNSFIGGMSGKVALPTKETPLRPYKFE